MVSSALVVTLLACIASTCVFSLDVAIINSLNVMQSFQNCTVENLALFATILLCSDLQYRTDFDLTPDLAGLNVTILYVGCVFAVPFAGFVLDKLGRRRGLMVGSVITLLGAILQASAQESKPFINVLFEHICLGWAKKRIVLADTQKCSFFSEDSYWVFRSSLRALAHRHGSWRLDHPSIEKK